VLKKSESDRIDEVERRLVRKFAQLPVGLIATAVDDAYLRFEDSLIRDYVPLLVERRAYNELARLALDHDPSIEWARRAADADLTMELAELASGTELAVELTPTH
jgi:hypothetical protein